MPELSIVLLHDCHSLQGARSSYTQVAKLEAHSYEQLCFSGGNLI